MRNDPPARLSRLRVGVRVSLRLAGPDGPTDRIGRVLSLSDDSLAVEDRSGVCHVIPRATIRLARIVPTVARGRNPRHAPRDLLMALAHDPALAADPPDGTRTPDCWVARLCDLVDHADDTGVTSVPGTTGRARTAASGHSRGLVNGEWAALRLVTATDLQPLAAWAARRNARNVVLTSPLAPGELTALGLQAL